MALNDHNQQSVLRIFTHNLLSTLQFYVAKWENSQGWGNRPGILSAQRVNFFSKVARSQEEREEWIKQEENDK